MIGELIDGYIGAIFAWGVWIKGSYLPEPFTYMYGGVQLMFIQIPLVIILANSLHNKLYGLAVRGNKRLLRNLPFVLILSVQLLLAYFFWLEYGSLAFFLGVLRTWSIALNSYLWYKTLTLPPEICE